jgi:outer membrane immunogenic protein
VGIVAGYNLQSGNWVFGVQADIEYLGDKTIRISELAGTPIADRVKVDWSGHVLARVGYNFDGWLPYITGGAALARVKASHTGLISPTDTFVWKQKDTRIGYTIGGGVERDLSNGWSARAEYLYDYWSDKRYDWVPGERYSNIALTIHSVRVGVVKRF